MTCSGCESCPIKRTCSGCENCPIRQLCEEFDDFHDKSSGGINYGLLTKIYNKGREDALDEVITAIKAENNFEYQAEQIRAIEFMKQLKEG